MFRRLLLSKRKRGLSRKIFKEKEEKEKERTFKEDFSRKRREREDFQGRFFKKEKRSERRKKKIENRKKTNPNPLESIPWIGIFIMQKKL